MEAQPLLVLPMTTNFLQTRRYEVCRKRLTRPSSLDLGAHGDKLPPCPVDSGPCSSAAVVAAPTLGASRGCMLSSRFAALKKTSSCNRVRSSPALRVVDFAARQHPAEVTEVIHLCRCAPNFAGGGGGGGTPCRSTSAVSIATARAATARTLKTPPLLQPLVFLVLTTIFPVASGSFLQRLKECMAATGWLQGPSLIPKGEPSKQKK